MAAVVLILVCIIAIGIYMFKSDSRDASQRVIAQGGMKQLFPNFVVYCESPLDFEQEPNMNLSKVTGEFLEYKKEVGDDGVLFGHLHFGIRYKFGVFIYSYFITKYGKKIEGYMKELKSPNGIPDLEREQYNTILENMFQKLAAGNEFQQYLSKL